MQRKKQLISHLARRAGFGSTPDEIDELIKLEYENVVLLTSKADYKFTKKQKIS